MRKNILYNFAFDEPVANAKRERGVVSEPTLRLDLHRHLEGSHSPAALCAVAAQFEITDPLFFDPATRRYRTAAELSSGLTMGAASDDPMVFYECIKKARAAYVSEAAIAELARLTFLEAADDTDGFEMRVSLFSMTRTLLENERTPWRELPPRDFAERARKLLLVVLAARDAAVAIAHKPMLVRVGFSRTFESEPHYRALAAVLPEHRASVSGLDVLGIVTGADPEPMPPALRSILEGLRQHLPDLTIHAGEFANHQSVERMLELRPNGIGHGVHSVESDATLQRLASEGVTLEVCPTSNLMLIPTALARLQKQRATTPLRALQQAKVHCVLGSDDPIPMGTCFAHEWSLAGELGVDLALLEADTLRRWKQLT